MKRILCVVIAMFYATVLYAQPGVSGFEPVTGMQDAEQLPAAPLVIAAYAFVWLAFLTYVFFIWKRLGKVEAEISTLSAQLAKKRP